LLHAARDSRNLSIVERPIYQDEFVTRYRADVREIADALPVPGVIVTDPPYGIRYCAIESYGATSARRRRPQSIVGDESTDLMQWIAARWADTPTAMFGSHKVAVPFRANATLIWEKGEHTGMGDTSMPWRPNWEMIFVRGRTWHGKRTTSVLRHPAPSNHPSRRLHPTEKPVELLREPIRKAPPGLILDPCCGSSATLEAARLEGRHAIGVEIDPRWCDASVHRLAASPRSLAPVESVDRRIRNGSGVRELSAKSPE